MFDLAQGVGAASRLSDGFSEPRFGSGQLLCLHCTGLLEDPWSVFCEVVSLLLIEVGVLTELRLFSGIRTNGRVEK